MTYGESCCELGSTGYGISLSEIDIRYVIANIEVHCFLNNRMCPTYELLIFAYCMCHSPGLLLCTPHMFPSYALFHMHLSLRPSHAPLTSYALLVSMHAIGLTILPSARAKDTISLMKKVRNIVYYLQMMFLY
jgi:hypothetical protein